MMIQWTMLAKRHEDQRDEEAAIEIHHGAWDERYWWSVNVDVDKYNCEKF